MVYLVSEKLYDEDFIRFLSQEDQDSLKRQSEDNDDWLYSEAAEDSDYLAFNKRTHDMNSLLDQADRRQL